MFLENKDKLLGKTVLLWKCDEISWEERCKVVSLLAADNSTAPRIW